MRITEFDDYRDFIRTIVKQRSAGSKGELTSLASHLRVQTSMMSQILKGSKNLSAEQAVRLCDYWNLDDFETEYFLLLIQYDRAGTEELRKILRRQIRRASQKTSEISCSQDTTVIPEKDRPEFYSSWFYSGIRLLTATPGNHTAESIATRFNLPLDLVQQVLEFLLRSGLCVAEQNRFKIGPARTHLDKDPSTRMRHHMNWRLKALDRLPRSSPPELFFSFPMYLGNGDSKLVRQMLLDLIEKINGLLKPSPPERLACLNIDWFDI